MNQYNIPGIGIISSGVPFTLNDIKYPGNWLELSTEQERDALNITIVEPEAPVLSLMHYEHAIEFHINSVVKERNYSTGISCASYVSSTNPLWAAEAAAFIAWRDAVWVYVFEQLAAVETEEREAPSISQLLSELPTISWPNE